MNRQKYITTLVLITFLQGCTSTSRLPQGAQKTKTNPKDVTERNLIRGPSSLNNPWLAPLGQIHVPGANKWMNWMLDAQTVHKRGALRAAGAIPVEMLRFYSAIGIMEGFHCFVHKDPTFCTSFGDSLWGDQALPGHVGFAAFMAVSGTVNSRLSAFLGKRLSPQAFQSSAVQMPLGQVGMNFGMAAQTLTQEFWMHPKTTEYFKLDGSKLSKEDLAKKREEWISSLYKDTVGNPDWRGMMYVEAANMLFAFGGAVATEMALFKALEKTPGVNKVPGKILDSLKNRPNMRAASLLMAHMLKYYTGTLLFLEYAELSKFPEWMAVRSALKKLKAAQENFETELKNSSGEPSPVVSKEAKTAFDSTSPLFKKVASRMPANAKDETEDLAPEDMLQKPSTDKGKEPKENDSPAADEAKLEELKQLLEQLKASAKDKKPPAEKTPLDKRAHELSMAWDEFRNALLQPTRMVQYRHADYLGQFDEKMTQIYYSYQWLAEGAKKEGKLWDENPVNWQKTMPDVSERIHQFFCGPELKDALLDAKDWHGIPVPGRGKPQVLPPRVTSDHPEFCKDFKVTLSPEQVQEERNKECKADTRLCTSTEVWNHSFRKDHYAMLTYRELQERKALISGDYTKKIDGVFQEFLKLSEPIRSRIIKRYDAQMQKMLVEILTGAKVAIQEGKAVRVKEDPKATSVLNAFASEAEYWDGVAKAFPNQKDLFERLKKNMEAKKKAAEDLLTYSSQSPQERAAVPLDQGSEEASGAAGSASDLLSSLMGGGQADPEEQAHQAVVQSWKDFILQ